MPVMDAVAYEGVGGGQAMNQNESTHVVLVAAVSRGRFTYLG
jgi:hypothetical protein